MDAGRLAPTGHNHQPWAFIVITDPHRIRHLSKAANWSSKAGAMIAVVLDPAETDYWLEDGAAAIENILLAATALGYGACWLEGNTRPNEAAFKLLLNIPAHLNLLTLIPLGIPAHWPEAPEKKPLSDILHWETF